MQWFRYCHENICGGRGHCQCEKPIERDEVSEEIGILHKRLGYGLDDQVSITGVLYVRKFT
jgi:hypothetical protein